MSTARSNRPCQSSSSFEEQVYSSSVTAILSWNRKVKAAVVAERPRGKFIRAFLYPLSGASPCTVFLPLAPDYDPDIPIWADDLRVREWFPFGYVRTRIASFPVDESFTLRNKYTMFTSGQPHKSPANEYVKKRWGHNVQGNIIVIRHSSSNVMRVTNMSAAERQFVDYLLATKLASLQLDA